MARNIEEQNRLQVGCKGGEDMAYDIGPRIGIEGEKEFRQAINDINTNMRTLKTEMTAVASQFDKNDKSQEAYTAKNEVLNKQIEEQRKKLEELTKGLQMSADKYGENDKVTQGWQQAVNKATAELNNMERELDSNVKSMDELGKEVEDTSKSVEGAGGRFEKFGGILKGVAVAAGTMVAAAGAAAVKLGKEVIAGFADYEQLVGGVDTLFKDSSQKLQDYANGAYKTAGLSANDYMETVTSFSASLISSLGGDTEKAVKYADMAITDMSDNANKMGSDMASIQNAYQGFAKQNYTMLDNLKLGYGGTKSEMERLLADAEKISGIEYDVSSYADIVDAIHIVQTEMGITGTTALEAEETISGSINAMKSAWMNWLVGLGNADADMASLTGNLVDGFQTVVKNIMPIISNIAEALPMAFSAMLPAISEILPDLLDVAANLFNQVLDALLQLLPELIPVAVGALLMIVDTVIDNLPLLIDAAFILIMALSQGILEALPELIPRIVEVVEKIVTVIIENLPMLITAALQIMLALASGLIQAIPQLIVAIPRIIGGIFNALISGIPEILGFIPTLFKELVTAFSKIEWGTLGKNIISGIADGIKNAASSLATSVVNAAKGALGGAKNFLGIESPSKVFRDQVGSMIGAGMAEGITDSSKEVDAAMSGLNRKLDVNANVGVTGGRGYGSGINRNVVEHTGTIRVEGVNDDNQVFSVVEIVLNELRREVRV
jgi:phage-related protein/uncharacterized protein YukE